MGRVLIFSGRGWEEEVIVWGWDTIILCAAVKRDFWAPALHRIASLGGRHRRATTAKCNNGVRVSTYELSDIRATNY